MKSYTHYNFKVHQYSAEMWADCDIYRQRRHTDGQTLYDVEILRRD